MRRILACVLFLAVAAGASSQAAEDYRPVLNEGIALFGQERFREALDVFNRLLAFPRAKAVHPDASYWVVLSDMALGDWAGADKTAGVFLEMYPLSTRVPDVLYQQGRAKFQQESYEQALQVFAALMLSYPSHETYPAALFWTAESLYFLGQLESSEKMFLTLLERFPDHVKTEAAMYRLSIIDLKYRETELLTLLKWSHEETLRITEEYQRREKTYEQAIQAYQKQLASGGKMGSAESQAIIAELEAKNEELKRRIAELEAVLSGVSISQAQAATPQATPSDATLAELLALKQRALDLLLYQIEWLAANQGATK